MGQPELPPDERGEPCRWENDMGICVLDMLSCELCELFEEKKTF